MQMPHGMPGKLVDGLSEIDTAVHYGCHNLYDVPVVDLGDRNLPACWMAITMQQAAARLLTSVILPGNRDALFRITRERRKTSHAYCHS
jgi:hypothetical protein